MLPGKLSEVDATALAAVCTNKWPEGQSLDFKRALPGTGDKARQEFMKDVVSFANAAGGDIIYGISDAGACADQLTPIDAATHSPDAMKRHLAQVLEAGIEPRIAGIEWHTVPVAGADYVLVVRVPASFQRPHRCKAGGFTRWPVRVDTRTVEF